MAQSSRDAYSHALNRWPVFVLSVFEPQTYHPVHVPPPLKSIILPPSHTTPCPHPTHPPSSPPPPLPPNPPPQRINPSSVPALGDAVSVSVSDSRDATGNRAHMSDGRRCGSGGLRCSLGGCGWGGFMLWVLGAMGGGEDRGEKIEGRIEGRRR